MPGPTTPSRDSERGATALLIIDVINRFDFEGGGALRRHAEAIVEPTLRLREAVDGAGMATVYINDNFGEWHSEKSRLIERARSDDDDFVDRLAPRHDDYFVLKPQFSGFYATNLPLLMPKLGVSRLVLAGVATDICILFTAADAHMRDYALWVPRDCVAAEDKAQSDAALKIMQSHLGAEVRPTEELDLSGWLAALDEQGVR